MRIPAKYKDIATNDSVDIDPDGTLFLWLNYGYAFDADEKLHCRGFDNWKELIESLKYVEPCFCDSCSEHEKGTVV